MSDAVMADFMRITDSFSSEELVSAISILSEKLQAMFARTKPKSTGSKEKEAITKLLDLANSLHLTSNGRGWTREELYER